MLCRKMAENNITGMDSRGNISQSSGWGGGWVGRRFQYRRKVGRGQDSGSLSAEFL